MKKLLTMASVIVLAVLFVTSGCKKNEEASALVLDQTKVCKVQGYLYAELNTTNTTWETVPAGTMIYFEVANSEYFADAEGKKVYTATVSSDGSYSVSIPTSPKGSVNVTAKFGDFKAVRTYTTGTPSDNMLFTLDDQNFTISHEGVMNLGDLAYDGEIVIR